MSDIFNYDNKLMQGLDKFFNVCYLSIVWLLACIPIITIGAANTALYYTANKVLKHNAVMSGKISGGRSAPISNSLRSSGW